jgi:DNA polymerase-3 subunit epsilon
VLSAPTFAELAPHVVQAVDGRTIVAHNVRFDLLFLNYELRRAGMELAVPPATGLCTMEWSGRFLRSTSRRLADCCTAARVNLGQAHAAASDALAVAGLLSLFIEATRPKPHWNDDLPATRAYVWPTTPQPWPQVSMASRGAKVERRPAAWLDRIVAGMPRHEDAKVESYLEILESALLDRYLSEYEEQALAQMAGLLGLDSSTLRGVHKTYLENLAAVALADDVVTDDERADLNQVAVLLGLSLSDVHQALNTPRGAHATERFRLRAGDQVCLTGQMSRPREAIEADAVERGLIAGGLTKKTRLLVAADPDSQSGKAAKARSYGVPVVTEEAFIRLLETL